MHTHTHTHKKKMQSRCSVAQNKGLGLRVLSRYMQKPQSDSSTARVRKAKLYKAALRQTQEGPGGKEASNPGTQTSETEKRHVGYVWQGLGKFSNKRKSC